MSIDTSYVAQPYIYQSKGLWARNIYDECPPYTYIQLMNCLEREENALSSRFGTQIVNRDAQGAGTSNYFFTSPVTTITRLNYQGNAWRYAGLQNGSLYRRAGNTHGAYSSLTLPPLINGATLILSGETFDSVNDSCFQTSQAYIFIADANGSIKDQGTGNPQLWGIDPPQYTANAVPYSPLLTLIDNFASTNSYTTSGFDGGTPWAYASITSLSCSSGITVTDFSQFTGVGATHTLAGTSLTTSQSGVGNNVQTTVISGFPSVGVSAGEIVTLTVPASGSAVVGGVGPADTFNAFVYFQYSINGGATWTSFGSLQGFYDTAGTYTLPNSPYTWTLPIAGLSNLNQLQVMMGVVAQIQFAGTSETLATTGVLGTISASLQTSGAFGDVCDGILSVLNANTLSSTPIVSVTASGLSSGVYTTLTVVTSTAHGLSTNQYVSLYATSNDLVDGFYKATVVNSTTFTVPFSTTQPISASGGTMYTYTAGTPSTCVCADEYSTPYPAQFSAWGFYQTVPTSTTSFPIGSWSGLVDASSTASVGVTANFDLSQNNQVTDADLIVLTLQVSDPANIANIRLQFDVNGSGYTSSYYYANIAPAYYQGNIANTLSAYNTTQQQILADTLGLITGQPLSSTTAQLQPSNFSTGSGSWVAVYIPRGNFLPVGSAGQSGLDWTNITGWQLVIDTLSTGSSTVACNGLYLQWGYGPSSFAGVGYEYRYTYYSAYTGTESSPSPEMEFNEQFGFLPSLSAPFYLRQAAQVTGYYSFDSQVTHIRMYRRGGTYNDNWRQIDQVPNITNGGLFYYKDVVADTSIAQAQLLVLDNDPPVTSSLVSPVQTTLSAATTGPGQSIYSTSSPQTITVSNSSAVFVPDQLVTIGNSNNLEVVSVVTGGTGQFTATVRLQHNAGEQVNVYAVPRQPCNLCAVAYNQVWLAGDPNNPHYLYYSKKGLPENFGPQNYIPVSTPDDPINAVINWRGTLIVGTLKSWYTIVGASTPYSQPTGSVHGIVAQQGWIEVEGAIWYQAADGLRAFTGADGKYMTLPVEWIFQNNTQCIPPQADTTQAASTILAFYNNVVYSSYVSLDNGGERYRINYDTNYRRFRQDDVAATAMFWEKDTNMLLVGKEISAGNYAVVQDQVGDYDDGGWNGSGILAKTPINLTIQHPYRDLGKPHEAKNWNMLETDCNTLLQTLNTTLLFEDGSISIVLPTINTGLSRQKAELIVTGSGEDTGGGQEAYRASILHTISVVTAPILYQETIHAAVLPEQRASYDSYFIKFGTDDSKFCKEGYFDYTSPVAVNVSLYVDGSTIPYFTFTLPAQPNRAVIRVRFSNVNSGTTAFTFRTWRIIMLSSNPSNFSDTFQLWAKPKLLIKPIGAGNSYKPYELSI